MSFLPLYGEMRLSLIYNFLHDVADRQPNQQQKQQVRMYYQSGTGAGQELHVHSIWWQQFSVWNDVMAVTLKRGCQIENPTPSVDAY